MNIQELQQYTKNNHYDGNGVEFYGYFPNGKFKCHWLDVYFGLVCIEGVQGFVSTTQLHERYPSTVYELIQKGE